MASKELEAATLDIENNVYVYINTYTAIERWIAANRENPNMTTMVGDGPTAPVIHAEQVLAIQDYMHGSAMIGCLMQIGRVFDRYLMAKVKPLVGTLTDDSWYSLDAAEMISGLDFDSLYGYKDVLSMNIMRAAIDAAAPLTISQPQLLAMATRVVGFIEDFDARFEIEQEVRRHHTRKDKRNVKPVEPKQIGDGSDSRPRALDAWGNGNSSVHSSERTDGPEYSLGPSDFASDPPEPDDYPESADHADDETDGDDWRA